MSKDNGNKDDFWDLSKLVPKKRGKLSPFASSDPTRDYTAPTPSKTEESTARPESERSLGAITGVGGSCEELTYSPEGNGLIKRVTIRHFIDKYDFYDNFRKSALIYYDYHPTAKAEFAQFYSYLPQYSQLNPQQKAYYFYWRGEMQRGRYLKSDYSYVHLYVYEILNLPDKIKPEEGIKLLCRVWREYRRALPRLDLYFSIWVQDYCLVHQLPCPLAEIEDFIFDVIAASTFKEFYLADVGRAGSRGTPALLAYLSDYDWRRGKYAAGDPDADAETKKAQTAEYRLHMEWAMSLLFRDLWDKCITECRNGKTAVVKRDAFPNSLCTHMVKRKLEIEYYPIADASGLRTGVTAAVRYTENKIRALLGIRSRLAIKDLPNDYRRIIDYYFDGVAKREEKKKKQESTPSYMHLYDASDTGMSRAGADEIERISWTTTARLVEGTEDESPDTFTSLEVNTPAVPTKTEDSTPTDSTAEPTPTVTDADTYGLSRAAIDYIAHLCLGRAYTPNAAMPVDTLVEIINEAFSDGFGDVIIEPTDDGYAIIDDYKEDITEWLNRITK